jgi:hypothetical protein
MVWRLPGALLCGCGLALASASLGPACSVESNDAEEAAARQRCEDTSSALFERRVAPLLSADRPKSCNQCHLAGVDLSLFVRSSACETVACLVKLGLADPSDPAQSQVLDWIRRAEPDANALSEEVLAEEYEGFRQWLTESLTCEGGACARARCTDEAPDAFCDSEAPLAPAAETPSDDCSEEALELLFRYRIFANRGRCFPCHHEGQANNELDAPRFFATRGNCNAASLATRRALERAGAFDFEAPERSLLLLKPLSENAGGVEHGGHAKFGSTSDPGYVAFLEYIERASTCSRR